jgi:hypothetical protein
MSCNQPNKTKDEWQLGQGVIIEVQWLFGNCKFVICGPALWKASGTKRGKRPVQVRAQYFVENSMTVWAQGNTVDLSIAGMNGFPLLLIDDVNCVWERISDATHHARNAIAFFVADDFPLDIRVERHQFLACQQIVGLARRLRTSTRTA